MGRYKRIEDKARLDGRTTVLKVTDDIDPAEVYGTTYQMRNFFQQMADGFFSSLDVMNYIQHHRAVQMMRKGDRVLDVCCGRGLLLPLIRYYKKEISEYVGVDIEERNIAEQLRRSGIKDISEKGVEEYYPFDLTHVLCSCEDMPEFLEEESFDRVVYTSAIEHMQYKAGYKSLRACKKLMKPGATLFLSCPNTMGKKDPYDTQYAAHLYEWDLDELRSALERLRFQVVDVFGLVGKVRDYESWLANNASDDERRIYDRLTQYMPKNWLMAMFPVLHPEAAAEVLIIARKPKKGELL